MKSLASRFLKLCLMAFVFLMVFHYQVTAFAQNTSAEVANQEASQSISVIAPNDGAKIESTLKDINSKIPISLPTAAVGIFAFLVEMYLRFKPSANPRSLLLLIASIFGLVGTIFTKISGLFDSLVQNIKDPNQLP